MTTKKLAPKRKVQNKKRANKETTKVSGMRIRLPKKGRRNRS